MNNKHWLIRTASRYNIMEQIEHGNNGWEPFAFHGDTLYFKKCVETPAVPRPTVDEKGDAK